jgi:hypothetical protein
MSLWLRLITTIWYHESLNNFWVAVNKDPKHFLSLTPATKSAKSLPSQLRSIIRPLSGKQRVPVHDARRYVTGVQIYESWNTSATPRIHITVSLQKGLMPPPPPCAVAAAHHTVPAPDRLQHPHHEHKKMPQLETMPYPTLSKQGNIACLHWWPLDPENMRAAVFRR